MTREWWHSWRQRWRTWRWNFRFNLGYRVGKFTSAKRSYSA